MKYKVGDKFRNIESGAILEITGVDIYGYNVTVDNAYWPLKVSDHFLNKYCKEMKE